METPANICTPQYLAETAGRIRDLAPERFSLTVHNRPAVEKMGMGLYLGAPNCHQPSSMCRMHERPADALADNINTREATIIFNGVPLISILGASPCV